MTTTNLCMRFLIPIGNVIRSDDNKKHDLLYSMEGEQKNNSSLTGSIGSIRRASSSCVSHRSNTNILLQTHENLYNVSNNNNTITTNNVSSNPTVVSHESCVKSGRNSNNCGNNNSLNSVISEQNRQEFECESKEESHNESIFVQTESWMTAKNYSKAVKDRRNCRLGKICTVLYTYKTQRYNTNTMNK